MATLVTPNDVKETTLQKSTTRTAKVKNQKYGGMTVSSVYNTKLAGFSDDTLYYLSYANNVARLCILLIKNAVTQTPWEIVHKKGFEKENLNKEKNYLLNLLSYPNEDSPIDTFSKLLSTVLEDVLVFDRGVIEKVRDLKGNVRLLYPVDGKTIKANIDDSGLFASPAYSQYLNSNDLKLNVQNKLKADAEFEKTDLLMFLANPRGGEFTGLGMSPIEQVIQTIVAGINAMNFNVSYFTSEKTPPGVLNLKGFEQDDLERFRTDFAESVKKKDHALSFVSVESLDYTSLRPSNQDMQFAELYNKLLETTVSAFGLTIQDVGFVANVNRSTSEVQAEMSKTRGVKTVMRVISEEINKDLIRDLSLTMNDKFKMLEFVFMPLDLNEQVVRANLDKVRIDSGVITPNEVRSRDGMEPLEEKEQTEKMPVEIKEVEKEDDTIEKSTISNLVEEALQKAEAEPEKTSTRPLFEDEKRVDLKRLGQIFDTFPEQVQKLFTDQFKSVSSIVETVVNEAKLTQDYSKIASSSFFSEPVTFEIKNMVGKLRAEIAELALKEIDESGSIQSTKLASQFNTMVDINVNKATTKYNTDLQNLALDAVTNDFSTQTVNKSIKDINETAKNVTFGLLGWALASETINGTREFIFKNSPKVMAMRFSAVLDGSTTDFCRSLNGKVFKLDDRSLRTIIPPNHFRCRSIMTPILIKDDAIITKDKAQGFGTVPEFQDKDAFQKSFGHIHNLIEML